MTDVARRDDQLHRQAPVFDVPFDPLDSLLHSFDISHLIVSGVATNGCVEATVRDTYFRVNDITVIRDCVAGPMLELHDATLKNIEIYLGERQEFSASHKAQLTIAHAGTS